MSSVTPTFTCVWVGSLPPIFDQEKVIKRSKWSVGPWFGVVCLLLPGSPVDQTKWLVFRVIHGFRIPDPTNGQSLVGLDFLGSWAWNGKTRKIWNGSISGVFPQKLKKRTLRFCNFDKVRLPHSIALRFVLPWSRKKPPKTNLIWKHKSQHMNNEKNLVG